MLIKKKHYIIKLYNFINALYWIVSNKYPLKKIYKTSINKSTIQKLDWKFE